MIRLLPFLSAALFLGMSGTAQEILRMVPDRSGVVNTTEKITFSLNAPGAEKVTVKFVDPYGNRLFVNGRDSVELTGRDGLFSASFCPASLCGRFAPKSESGDLRLIPVIRKVGRETVGKIQTPPWRISGIPFVTYAGEVKLADGKFGSALHFPGKESMVYLRTGKFTPEGGTIDGWIYLPPLTQKEEGIVFHISSADSSPWSYQTLKILGNSRKLQYLIYRSGGKEKIAAVTTKDLYEDDWGFFRVSWSLPEGRMRLYVNGSLIGEKAYLEPAGGNLANYELGGRIHNAGKQYQIIGSANILLDEFRVSSVPTPNGAAVPSEKAKAAPDTAILLPFDAPAAYDNFGTAK